MEHFNYNYDQLTGAYIGASPCHESPEENGVHLLPAWATHTPPPVTAEGETAFFLFGEWVVKPSIVEEVIEAAAMGILMEPEDKVEVLQKRAGLNIDAAAKALGFKDMADAITYIGENTQAGLDAKMLRDWRAVVNVRLQDVYKFYAENKDAPLPVGDEFVNLFATVPLERKFKIHETPEVATGLDEMNRVLEAAAAATQAKVNFTPEQVAAEMAKVAR